jgi:pimeloyl-ACP methyl ester carboxylesterase
MASDALAVLDTLNLPKAHLVGWSDGACISLVLAMQSPSRVASVFFFACNMDPTGTKEFHFTPTIRRCLNRHTKDYALLSPTPDQFDSFSQAVGLMMQSQPNYSSQDLSKIHLPVAIVQSPDDEFIKLEHAQYLAQSIPNSQLILLSNVTHFAPLQHPDQFNTTLLTFLQKIPL